MTQTTDDGQRTTPVVSHKHKTGELIIQWKIEKATEVEDHRVGWELIKFYIRRETIQYCKKYKAIKDVVIRSCKIN